MSYTDKTVADIRSEVRTLYNEPSALTVSDATLALWIDEVARDLARTALILEEADDESFQLATSTETYALASMGLTDHITIDALIYFGASNTAPGENARALLKMTPRHVGNSRPNTDTGGPQEWAHVNNSILVLPAPTVTQNAHYVHVLYHKYITEYVTDTTYHLPPYLQEYVIWGVLAKCYERDGQHAVAQQYWSYYHAFILFHARDRFNVAPDSIQDMKVPDLTQFA